MAMGSYRYFRLLLKRSSAASQDWRYYAINEFYLYANNLGTGDNLLFGATATTDGSYQSQTPNLAIDGNTTTYWESSLHDQGVPAWIAFQTASPISPRSFRIVSTSQSLERPIDFELQVSVDGVIWQTLRSVVGWPNSNDNWSALDLKVQGIAKLSNGVKASRVLIQSFSTGALQAVVTPGNDGAWAYYPQAPGDLLVTTLGPSGFKPEADGPITPYLEP